MGFVDDTLSLMESWGVGLADRKAFVSASRWKRLDDLGLDERQSNALSCTFTSLLLRRDANPKEAPMEQTGKNTPTERDLLRVRYAVLDLMVASGWQGVESALHEDQVSDLRSFVVGDPNASGFLKPRRAAAADGGTVLL